MFRGGFFLYHRKLESDVYTYFVWVMELNSGRCKFSLKNSCIRY